MKEISGWFWERFLCFRFSHAIWKKRPPPKSPQGFNIHQPAPRLRREGGKRAKEVERENQIARVIERGRERERERGREEDEKLQQKWWFDWRLLEFDEHLSENQDQPNMEVLYERCWPLMHWFYQNDHARYYITKAITLIIGKGKKG